MIVKFGMDTEQIDTNATNIFWMHLFISDHKKVEYIFRNHVSIAHVTERNNIYTWLLELHAKRQNLY